MSRYTFLTNFNKKLTPYYEQTITETERILNKRGLFSISKKAFGNNGNPVKSCHSIWYRCTIEELQTFHSVSDEIVSPHAQLIVIEDLKTIQHNKTL